MKYRGMVVQKLIHVPRREDPTAEPLGEIGINGITGKDQILEEPWNGQDPEQDFRLRPFSPMANGENILLDQEKGQCTRGQSNDGGVLQGEESTSEDSDRPGP